MAPCEVCIQLCHKQMSVVASVVTNSSTYYLNTIANSHEFGCTEQMLQCFVDSATTRCNM